MGGGEVSEVICCSDLCLGRWGQMWASDPGETTCNFENRLISLVGGEGFEPATPGQQSAPRR
jgi:hypothetical protein